MENDVSVNVVLWDSFLYVCYWVHDFNSQVKSLKYSSIHLNEMLKELFVPLIERVEERLLTVGSEYILSHFISRLSLKLLELVNLYVVLGDECGLRKTLHEQWPAEDVLVTLIGCCYARNCKETAKLRT